MDQIKLPNGKSALALAQGRILNEEEIIVLNREGMPTVELGSQESIFSGSFKKDLGKVPGLDLERAIIIDDQAEDASELLKNSLEMGGPKS